MIKYTSSLALVALIVMVGYSEARSLDLNNNNDNDNDDPTNGVIPSPNQEFGDESSDLRRQPNGESSVEEAASNEASVPVYVSPFVRSERAQLEPSASVTFDSPQESSHAPPNYAPRPSASTKDLKASASYGHHHGHHGGHHGYDHSGWLDMGAWTGGKGSFGWYADYPVGKHGHGYGRK